MTSTNGETWTQQSAVSQYWNGLAYGGAAGSERFVAVGNAGAIMTSPDGVTWTSRTSPAANSWTSVTYGNGMFIAVSSSGVGNRLMTSVDGVTWTAGTSSADNAWNAVAYGNGVFVAVASSGTGNRVMTSSDGATWTTRSTAPSAGAGDSLAGGNAGGAGGGATAVSASALPTIPGKGRCKRTRCKTTGKVPNGATTVRQIATRSGKTVKGACKLKAVKAKGSKQKGKGKAKAYTCRLRLSKGTWTITTEALKGGVVMARTVTTRTVK